MEDTATHAAINPTVLREAEEILQVGPQAYKNQTEIEAMHAISVLHRAEGMVTQLKRRIEDEFILLRSKEDEIRRTRKKLLHISTTKTASNSSRGTVEGL